MRFRPPLPGCRRCGHSYCGEGRFEVPGHGLPLEQYPEQVWKRFIFEQQAVAEEVGASPVALTPEEAAAN